MSEEIEYLRTLAAHARPNASMWERRYGMDVIFLVAEIDRLNEKLRAHESATDGTLWAQCPVLETFRP